MNRRPTARLRSCSTPALSGELKLENGKYLVAATSTRGDHLRRSHERPGTKDQYEDVTAMGSVPSAHTSETIFLSGRAKGMYGEDEKTGSDSRSRPVFGYRVEASG